MGIVDCSLTPQGILFVYLFGVIKNTMMNAYFFQMNNLKGLAADESGSSVLVDRLARSDGFTVRSSVGWTSSAGSEKKKKMRRSSGQQSIEPHRAGSG